MPVVKQHGDHALGPAISLDPPDAIADIAAEQNLASLVEGRRAEGVGILFVVLPAGGEAGRRNSEPIGEQRGQAWIVQLLGRSTADPMTPGDGANLVESRDHGTADREQSLREQCLVVAKRYRCW